MKKLSLFHTVICIALHLSTGFVLSSCDKTPDDGPPIVNPTPCTNCLPPITKEGKGTFGCKVNGKVWLPKAGDGFSKTGLDYFQSELTFNAYNNTAKEAISISIKPISDTGYYDFKDTLLESSRGWYGNVNGNIDFLSKPIKNGRLHLLRFEPSSTGIVSGIFEFDAYNSEGDTIHITDGRFDLHF